MAVINLCRNGNRILSETKMMKKTPSAIWCTGANQSMSAASATRTIGGLHGHSNDHQPPGCASSPLGL